MGSDTGRGRPQALGPGGRAQNRGAKGARPTAPARPARHSLLGRTPHRRLPALQRRSSGRARRRGPRLRSQLLHAAAVLPRSRMGHRPPTHGRRASATTERRGAPPVGAHGRGCRRSASCRLPRVCRALPRASPAPAPRPLTLSKPGAAGEGGASRDAVPAHAPARVALRARRAPGAAPAHAPLPRAAGFPQLAGRCPGSACPVCSFLSRQAGV